MAIKITDRVEADVVVRFYREGKIKVKGKSIFFPIKDTGNRPLDYRWSMGEAVEFVKNLDVGSVFFKKPSFVSERDWYRFFYEGALLSYYEYADFKNSARKDIDIYFQGRKNNLSEVSEIYADATNYTRDLVNTPPNVATPEYMVKCCENLSKEYNYELRVFDKNDLEKMGMNAFLAVNWGSEKPPFLVHIKHSPENPKGRVVLVGKAITFDSGGLSLKTPQGMITMKMDKSGACAVLGVFKALKKLKVEYEVHGIFAATENMPDGNALRPGDIIKTYSGKTVEIISTDAEGRLTLADALWYACEQNPDHLIDMATLTGASIVALGEFTAALFSTDDKLANALLKAGYIAGERLWRLPLEDPFLYDKMKTYDADLKNSSGDGWGGAIYAAIFLKEFVKDGIPWAHIDLAGPVFNLKRWAYNPEGATGFGVRTILNFLRG